MKIFGTDSNTRGCFIRFDVDTGKSHGAVLKVPTNKSDNFVTLPTMGRANHLALLISSVSFTQKENVSHLKCFNTRVYTYTFGADIGSVQVNFTGFLGKGREYKAAGGGLATGNDSIVVNMLKAYEAGRISKSRREAVLSIGESGEVIRGQIVGISSSTRSPEANIQSFVMDLATIPKPDKKKATAGLGFLPPGSGVS